MRKAFDRFYGKITSGSVALVFFSGYAIQSARQSYIIPVDGQIWTEPDVRRDGVSLDTILKEMNTRGARVKIAILDASRRNPFERRFRPVSAGLAPVDAPTGSLVMYSSAPSTVVNDSGNEHRLFVNELVSHLRVAELTAQEVFDRTRVGVSRGSQGQQVPWLSSSLVSDFSFGSGPKVAAAAPATSAPAAAPAAPATPGPRPVVIPKWNRWFQKIQTCASACIAWPAGGSACHTTATRGRTSRARDNFSRGHGSDPGPQPQDPLQSERCHRALQARPALRKE